MAIQNVVSKVLKSYRSRGLCGTVVRCLLSLMGLVGLRSLVRPSRTDSGKEFDEKHGVETCGVIELNKLQVDSLHRRYGVRYQAVAPATFNNIMARLEIEHDEYIFIDIGSGKGRALILASAYPFKKIIGVEFSSKLHKVALENIVKFRFKDIRCKDINSVCMDAMEFKIPYEPAVFYFYNPFESRIMKAILKNIERSLENSSRSVWLVFVNVVVDELTEELKNFSRVYCDMSERKSLYTRVGSD